MHSRRRERVLTDLCHIPTQPKEVNAVIIDFEPDMPAQ
jgi:hypothetical protein